LLSAGHMVVVIEHDMAFLRRFARTVTVMHAGKILSEGTVAQVQADPKVQEVYLGHVGESADAELALPLGAPREA
jgi:urea transport system ATP-binding protein